jgi:aspartate dehydrogenase
MERGVDVIGLSPACLLDPAVEARFAAAAAASGRRLLIPPGSADGVETLLAARRDNLRSARLTLYWKPTPQNPYTGQGEPQEIFVGTAREAGLKYPLNANFVVALARAGLGLDRTEVRINLDRDAENNHYLLEAIADGVELRAAVQLRRPSGRSGRMAALSGIEALDQLARGGVAAGVSA